MRIFLIGISLLLSLHVGAKTCRETFDRKPIWSSEFSRQNATFPVSRIPGVKVELIQRLQSVWGAKSWGHLARQRYEAHFREIFDDVDISLLSNAKIVFSDRYNANSLASTVVQVGRIAFIHDLKNHPLYPVIHAHELQHIYDFKTHKIEFLTSTGLLTPQKMFPLHEFYSEIRAFYRSYKVFKTLFTREELEQILEAEKNPVLRTPLELFLRFENEPRDYITYALENGYSHLMNTVRNLLDYQGPRFVFTLRLVGHELAKSDRPEL